MPHSEVWRPVKGYEGLYEISSHGRLKRLAGESPMRNKHKTWMVPHDEKLISGRVTHGGYLAYELRTFIDGVSEKKRVLAHRLVADAFLGRRPKDCNQVNHRNGYKLDNYFGNLEWSNNSENQKHAYRTGLSTAIKSWDDSQSKPVCRIDDDGAILHIYGSSGAASIETGIPASEIRRVCRNERKSAGGYNWKFLNPKINNFPRRRPVSMRKPDSRRIIAKYDSIVEAAEANNVHPTNITKACRGQQKTAGGFRWDYRRVF